MDKHVVILGLPGSGKTTFLAALWHLVTARDIPTALRFESLLSGDASHLNALAQRWRMAKRQGRTPVGTDRLVSMNLVDASDAPVRLTFPDLSGEYCRRMWEERDCPIALVEVLEAGSGVLLFIHADDMVAPAWVVDVADLARQLGAPIVEGKSAPWDPRRSPTQVQLVDILQMLREPPLDRGPRRVAILLSAWDKAEGELLEPAAFLKEKLPLLYQYFEQNADAWTWRVYGLSAQGGEYEDDRDGAPTVQAAEELRAMDQPSLRIRLTDGGAKTNDLTEPVAWLFR
jgi:hypothetical protein